MVTTKILSAAGSLIFLATFSRALRLVSERNNNPRAGFKRSQRPPDSSCNQGAKRSGVGFNRALGSAFSLRGIGIRLTTRSGMRSYAYVKEGRRYLFAPALGVFSIFKQDSYADEARDCSVRITKSASPRKAGCVVYRKINVTI